jgi:serine protease Do
VLYRDDGYLLTNAHVVDGALAVEVVLVDGTAFDGAVVGRDPWTDIAVVKVNRTGLPIAALGTSDDLQVGEQAITIGASLDDTGPSVTVGVISARGRHVRSASGTTLHGMLATDAPVIGESSGGALVDRTGAVIGIATAVADGDLSTMGYATPIELATSVADGIIATGKAHHVWLGIEGDDLSSGKARDLNIGGGVLVSKVAPGSPADGAGLQGGDVLTAVNGEPVTSMSSLVATLRAHAPGDAVAIDYVRDGDHGSCTAALSEKDNP